MKHSRKAQNGETRTTAPTVSGLKSNQNIQRHGNGSGEKGKALTRSATPKPPAKRTKIGKAIDSRSAVIQHAKQAEIGIAFHVTPPELAQALMAIRYSLPGSTARTQEARLEKALRKWSLTTFEMLKWLDLYDPRARIQGLRLAGHEILRTWVVIETDCGQRHRVGRFALQRGTKAPAPEQSDLFGSPAVAAIDAEGVPA
jgi:hypothetical protein